MIPLSKPVIGNNEEKAVLKVLKSGILASGEQVRRLENNFSRICGTAYSLAVNNGTAALHTAIYSVISPGDEIITTPFTFVATANAILMAGGVPVFADIDQSTFNIDPEEIEKKISKKTKAILAVNLYGQPANYAAIKKIAIKHKLKVIEDAAQSVGAECNGKKSGAVGDVATFSLYATKNIMCGEGGIITTDSGVIYKKMAEFINHGQPIGKKYTYNSLGYNYRLTDLQAAIAIAQCARLKSITGKRQATAAKYTKAFSKIKGLITPRIFEGNTHVFHQYTLRVTDVFPLKRDALQKYLLEKKIQSNIYYPVPLYRFNHLKFNNNSSDFPETEKAVREVLSIPVHPLLNDMQINHIISTIIRLK